MRPDAPIDLTETVAEAASNVLLMQSPLEDDVDASERRKIIRARHTAQEYTIGGWRVLREFDVPMLAAILFSLRDNGFTFRPVFFTQFHLSDGVFIDPSEFDPEMLEEFIEMSGSLQRIFSDAFRAFGEHAELAKAAGVDNEDWEKLITAVFVAAALNYQQ